MQAEHPATKAVGIFDNNIRSAIRGVLQRGDDAFPAMRASYCGAHVGMYVIDPFGDIYACWERTGDKNIRIGWIEEDGTPQFVADRAAQWRSRTISSNETCAQCRYATYCGGGCAVLAEGVHETIFGNYCDAFGRRFRLAVGEAFTEHMTGPNHVDESVELLRGL